MRRVFLIAAALMAAGLPNSTAAQTGTGAVTGTVTATGVRSSADVVVSLQATGVTVTAPSQPIEMDQKRMLFIPHVLPVVTGTTVAFLNSDPVPHNVFSPQGKYNLGSWPTGESRSYTFDKPGVYTQLCRVHPEMEAFVVVLDTPHFATTDSAGRYEIKGVPAGTYTLIAWGPRLKEVEQSVTVAGGQSVSVNLAMSR
jgi:plastocyanin